MAAILCPGYLSCENIIKDSIREKTSSLIHKNPLNAITVQGITIYCSLLFRKRNSDNVTLLADDIDDLIHVLLAFLVGTRLNHDADNRLCAGFSEKNSALVAE